MEHTRITNTLKRMFCGVPPSDLSRNMDIAHRGMLMNLRCKAVFTGEIGQYSGIELLSRRLQIMRLCYLMPFLLKDLHKTPYYRETLDRNLESEMYLYCWWVSPVSRLVIAQSGKLQTNAGNDIKKHSLRLIFTFYLNRGTPVLELFPAVVFQ